MLAPITSLALPGLLGNYPPPGVVPVVGPVVTMAFTLPLAGPAPNVIQGPPQACQDSSDNVELEVQVVDQDGNPVDLSAATGLQFWLLAPDGTPRPLPAAFVSNGMDGLISYTTDAQDLPEAGLWSIQAMLTFGERTFTTRWGSFWAGANIA